MEPKFYSSMNYTPYSPIWNKYRPVILQLMMASENGPQEYSLSDHEFKAINAKEKAYSFELHAFQGKAVNNIKTSPTAQDLLAMLNLSRKASDLLNEGHYSFSMDKKFILKVSKVVPTL